MFAKGKRKKRNKINKTWLNASFVLIDSFWFRLDSVLICLVSLLLRKMSSALELFHCIDKEPGVHCQAQTSLGQYTWLRLRFSSFTTCIIRTNNKTTTCVKRSKRYNNQIKYIQHSLAITFTLTVSLRVVSRLLQEFLFKKFI